MTDKTCTCGHVADEHGGDQKHPGSTACAVEGCDCICFDEAEQDEEDDLKKDRFIQGAACAIAIINRNHDEPTMCAEALVAIGPTTPDELRAAGVEEYDIEGLRSVFRHLENRRRI